MPDEAAAALHRVSFADAEDGIAGQTALATLFALGGRPDEFLGAVAEALAHGADPEGLLNTASLLPGDVAPGVIEDMLRLFPEVEWDYRQAADALFAFGLTERGLAVLTTGLQRHGENLRLVLGWMGADPEGGVARFLPGADLWEMDALTSVADTLLGQKRGELAFPFLRIALAKEPRSDEALMLLARANAPAAVAHAEWRVADDEGDDEAWRLLGRMRAEAGDLDGAFAAYRERFKREVDGETLWEAFEVDAERALPILAEAVRNTTDDEAIGNVAKAYLEAGHKDDAFREYLRAYALDRRDSEWLHALVQLDANRALDALGARVKESPETASDEEVGAYARALLAAGRHSEALDYYRIALQKDPGDSEWMTGIARADPVRAVPVLREMVAKSPNDPSRKGALAVALGGAGQREAALALFRELASTEGRYRWYREMARLAPAEALAGLREELAVRPDDDELWGAYAKTCMDLGRTAEALDALRKARELDPTDTEWRLLQGGLR